eukprot:519157-Amphidinium_carterae.1
MAQIPKRSCMSGKSSPTGTCPEKCSLRGSTEPGRQGRAQAERKLRLAQSRNPPRTATTGTGSLEPNTYLIDTRTYAQTNMMDPMLIGVSGVSPQRHTLLLHPKMAEAEYSLDLHTSGYSYSCVKLGQRDSSTSLSSADGQLQDALETALKIHS